MFDEEVRLKRPYRWAMIGGGRGSQIGYIHRSAALRDGIFELKAGAFDIDSQRAKDFGQAIGLDKNRCYGNYREMLAEEAKRRDGIEVVSIATPNKFHYEMCKASLEAGLHVICEKPLCFTSGEGEELKKLAEEKKKMLCVTYGYTGYPMVHQARKMIEKGDLGDIRIVYMTFAYGWHSEKVEDHDPGTRWRVSPQTAGPSYILGDLGTHSLYMAELMVPDFKIEKLMCSRQSFVKSRAPLEDNAFVLMNLKGGAVAHLWASSVNAGAIHEQRIRVVGSKASIEWWDEHPNQLSYEIQGKAKQILDRGQDYLYEDSLVKKDRISCGHAEGLFESWANLYSNFGFAMDAKDRGDEKALAALEFPGIDAGIYGVRFIENCVKSADNGAAWVDFK